MTKYDKCTGIQESVKANGSKSTYGLPLGYLRLGSAKGNTSGISMGVPDSLGVEVSHSYCFPIVMSSLALSIRFTKESQAHVSMTNQKANHG